MLYLLHGIGGDETEWQRACKAQAILDNLIADGQAVPMIVVMLNGRAQKNGRAEGNVFAAAPAFAAFEQDLLLRDAIPTIEARYSVQADREHRALAGCPWGAASRSTSGCPPRYLRLGRRPLVRAQHEASGRAGARPGGRQGKAEAALARLR